MNETNMPEMEIDDQERGDENVVYLDDPLKLWKDVEKTDPDYTKKAAYGTYHFTAINATYQIKQATKQWGPFGGKWGARKESFDFVTNEPINWCLYRATFYCPEAEFSMSSAIQIMRGEKFDNDFTKKLETDAITKALSRLGFNADVFMGRFDDSKYVEAIKKEFDIEEASQIEVNENHVDEVGMLVEAGTSLSYYCFVNKFEDEYRMALMDRYFEPFRENKTITKEKENMKKFYHEGQEQFGELVVRINTLLIQHNSDAVADILEENTTDINNLLIKKIPELKNG